jgi:UDP:flavonoid glycosyltransferase YjiC (YdhE family)
MGHVLVSPLNWGLGHASRDVPVIRELLRHHHEVTIAAEGNALLLLQREFPTCKTIDLPDYPLANNTGRFFFPRFTAHVPTLVKAFSDERKNLRKILTDTRYDLIISDSRPGVYSETIPSIQITHQIHQSFPFYAWPIECIGLYINGRAFRKYGKIIIPDNPPGPLSLAGKLSRTSFTGAANQSYYSGILASIPRVSGIKQIDYLFLISGMEPQRTALEKILLPEIGDLPGKKVVLLGKPSEDRVSDLDDDTTIYSYVSYREKVELMSAAKFIVSRSGYTTMMDLAEIDAKKGLFIPTAGQWEQEYLSAYYKRKGWFKSVSQFRVRLAEDIDEARDYSGFPDMPKTEENVRMLYDELLAGYLE